MEESLEEKRINESFKRLFESSKTKAKSKNSHKKTTQKKK